MNLCIIQSSPHALSETFIRAHQLALPATVTAVHNRPPRIGTRHVLAQTPGARIFRLVRRKTFPQSRFDTNELAYRKVLLKTRADAVLAEYGLTGVHVMHVCRELGIPLIVHFHGYDATRNDILNRYAKEYTQLFHEAGAIIAVSYAMREKLISLGAPPEKVFYNPCGVDCANFGPVDPSLSDPVFLAVGRFVQKKAPHLLLLAFAEVISIHPEARLCMIGDGSLMGACRDMASALHLENCVQFMGAQPHHVVQKQMQLARAFVQHSLIAENGDSEGTPVSLLEAGASGLPVVSTFHGGIPDVVLHERTGLLVRERDVHTMAMQMVRLIEDPALAARLGAAASDRIRKHFGLDQSIARLWTIIQSCVEKREMPPVDHLEGIHRTNLSTIDPFGMRAASGLEVGDVA